METPVAIDNTLTDFVPYFGFGFFLVSSYLPPQVLSLHLLRHCGSRISAMFANYLSLSKKNAFLDNDVSRPA